jgi:hypothetical protein
VRAQVVQPAGLFARDLFGLDRLDATAAAEPSAALAARVVTQVGVVVGPLGTARSHGSSLPAVSPLSSCPVVGSATLRPFPPGSPSAA